MQQTYYIHNVVQMQLISYNTQRRQIHLPVYLPGAVAPGADPGVLFTKVRTPVSVRKFCVRKFLRA